VTVHQALTFWQGGHPSGAGSQANLRCYSTFNTANLPGTPRNLPDIDRTRGLSRLALSSDDGDDVPMRELATFFRRPDGVSAAMDAPASALPEATSSSESMVFLRFTMLAVADGKLRDYGSRGPELDALTAGRPKKDPWTASHQDMRRIDAGHERG
jgi:hypothetical protein